MTDGWDRRPMFLAALAQIADLNARLARVAAARAALRLAAAARAVRREEG